MLNLISPASKAELKEGLTLKEVQRNILLVVIILLFCAGILFLIYLLLNNSVIPLQNDILQSKIKFNEEENIKNEIISFNQLAVAAKTIQDEHRNPFLIVELFSNQVGDGITISSLNIDLVKNTMAVQGVARDRDSLLNWQNQLNEITEFTFDYPLETLSGKENIDFSFEGTVNQGTHE